MFNITSMYSTLPKTNCGVISYKFYIKHISHKIIMMHVFATLVEAYSMIWKFFELHFLRLCYIYIYIYMG